jgi:hypothetical protein
VEEDTYITTELSGLYRYKSIYNTTSCNDENYVSSEYEVVQPYFVLEGRKTDYDENEIIKYYCVNQSFESCLRTDENGDDLGFLIGTGVDKAWVFNTQLNAKYDYTKKVCVFMKEIFNGYSFNMDILELKYTLYTYEETQETNTDCKIKNMDSSKFECSAKSKYSMKKELISDRDQEYFDKLEEEENTKN